MPLIDFDGRGWSQGGLASYVDAARQLGYSFISANDHLAFQRPWFDCIVALASVIDRSGEMGLATTVSLPVVRGPAALAKAAAALGPCLTHTAIPLVAELRAESKVADHGNSGLQR